MKEFIVKGRKGNFLMKLPTSLSEITDDYLTKVTDGIKLPAEHSIVALIYKEKLAIILNQVNKRKETGTAVIPVFVKTGETESAYIKNLKVNSKIIIDPTDVVRGHHVNCPQNLISVPSVMSMCAGSQVEKESIKEVTDYYFVEFKIVHNCDIHGNYPDKPTSFENPFVNALPDDVDGGVLN